MTRLWRSLSLLGLLLLPFTLSTPAAAAPAAPSLSSPANGAAVFEPFTIAWSSVTDANGVVAYNWQVSPASTFSPVVLQGSTNGGTSAVVSGLANGTFFWRVQAVNSAFEQGVWSQPRTFTVNGSGAGAVAPPTLDPTKAYSTFHPHEVMTFTWSAVPGAATYLLQASTDPSFPVVSVMQFDNIPNTTYSFAIANPEGNYVARVFAVDANGIRSQPSNTIDFSVFYDNPIGPAPVSVSPSGETLTLPVTFTWQDVPNPQPSGYELEVATDSKFSNVEFDYNQITPPTYTLTSLTPGTKFWRVRSAQGDASPTTAAETAWSQVRSFTVSTAPPTPVSVSATTNPLASGDTTWVAVQLTSAVPSTGATIALASSNPSAAPVPATITIPGNTAWTQFQMQAGQVTASVDATITATLNSKSASGRITITPTALKSLTISPSSITGGAQPTAIVMLTGQAPPGGASVTLSSNSPAVTPPASVFIAPGSFSVSVSLPTTAVSAPTAATVTASWNGTTMQAPLTLTPQAQPASLTLNPTSTVGQSGGSFATVRIASPQSADLALPVTSSNPAVASVPSTVTIPAGATAGGFNIFTTAVTSQTVVTISVSGGGATVSAPLTVLPSASTVTPAVTGIVVQPSSVTGGNSAQATVTLSTAAPAGGAAVQLTSSNTSLATVPASVTVPAGATSATVPVTTAAVTTARSVVLTAAAGGASASATLSLSPAQSSTTATLTVTASGRSGESVRSTPSGLTVAVGSTGSATFAVGTSITLSVTNGRDAIWSGACSSGGNKRRSCTFTLTGNASVTANVK
jgi:hypothetical protein